MRGDEKGLGDPIEDAVSVGAVANCALKVCCVSGIDGALLTSTAQGQVSRVHRVW